MKTFTLAVVSLSSLLLGCSGDSLDEAEGIYLVDSHTENLQACEEGGMSLVEAEAGKYMVARQGSAFGQSFLSMQLCDDPADCRAAADGIDAAGPFALLSGYSIVDDNGDLKSSSVLSGNNRDEVCSGGRVEATQLTLTDKGVALVVERTEADDHPSENGECTLEGTEAAVANKACSVRIDLRATFVEAL